MKPTWSLHEPMWSLPMWSQHIGQQYMKPVRSLHEAYIIIIIINRRSGITSHTSHGHKTGTRSMQPVRSVPLGGPVVS